MASIQTGIELNDQFTSVIYGIINAVNLTVSSMEDMQRTMNADMDTSGFTYVRDEINQAAAAMDELNDALQNQPNIRDNTAEQTRFNRTIANGTNEANQLLQTIKSTVGAFAGIVGIKKAFGFIKDCTESFDTQLNAETQLIGVLANMLDEESVAQFEIETTADTVTAIDEIAAIQDTVNEVVVPISAEAKALTATFDQITDKAAEIQSRGIYGDEAMIAAAAEFSTYFTDADAIEMMMDTLADYAMGMSGGGEIGSKEMVDYATNLGKIMSGAYDAMTKKGFELSDAQKEIIEGTATHEQIVATLGEEYVNMSGDMQAAAAISQVIEESWSGLYENMSNTPEGKIIQMTNAWGDMKEVIGGQLYPYVLLFVDAITGNWDTIENVVSGITTGLEYMLGVLSWLTNAAITFSGIIASNWSWIAPIIYGIAGAVTVFTTALLINNAIQTINTGLKKIAAIHAVAHGAAITEEMIATTGLTEAQIACNAAIYACPVVWIIGLIIALIAVFYAAVAAVNKFAGTSVSATGIICGVFTTAAAFIGNLFVAMINFVIDLFFMLWTFIAAFANFLVNVLDDPVAAIARLFFDLVDCLLGLLQTLAGAIDAIFGSGLADAVQGWRDGLGDWVDSVFGEGKEFITLTTEDTHIGRFEYGDAWDAGYSFGEGIDESIGNPLDLFDATNIPSASDYASSLTATGISDGVEDISDHTGSIADSLDITEEDLKYLRDLAEQESVNRYTVAEVSIDMSGMQNTVNNGTDLDGFVSDLTDAVNEAVDTITEGVHE